MKINRLQVKGFGKIEEFNTDLSSGLNVIYGPNESGKSTLMAFIKAMLYGLKGGRASKDGLASESKRYAPWSKATYGGYMNFELDNGSTYRIERAFDNGTVKLYDESFNDITSSFADSKDGSGIAEKLIGINESLFERTVYIRQLGTKIDNSASKDLIDRISNIRQSGSEDISYKKADSALKEALKQQVGTDRSYTRPLDIINKRLEELNITKTRIQGENKNALDTTAKQEDLAFQISKLTAKESFFAKLIEFCDLKEKLRLQYEKNEEIDFLNAAIKQAQKNINTIAKDKEVLQLEIDTNSKLIDTLSDKQDYSEQIEQIEQIGGAEKQRTHLKALNICSILSLIAVIGVGSGAFIFNVIKPWLIAVPVLITIVFAALRQRSSRVLKQLENEQRGRYDEKDKHKNELKNAQRINQILQQQRLGLDDRIINEKTQYEQLIKKQGNHNIHFKQIDIVELENTIDSLSEKISELRLAVALDLNRTEIEICENVLENNSEGYYLRMAELKEFLTAQIQQKKIEKATVEANFKKSELTQNEESIDDEIARLTQQKCLLEQRGKALSIAIKTLEEATNNVQKKYIPVMNKVFKDTFYGLTAQKYSDIRAGENLSIMLSDPKTQMVVPVSLLSSGTIDQLYLALRIAISETVLKITEKLPFIMDEPFAQYDDERTDNALKCIYEISKMQQVIIFTCKQREVDLISNKYPCKICSLT